MKPLEDFVETLCDLSETLAIAGIDWAVAGAAAANMYRDQIRTTTDVDVILSLSDRKVDVVLDALHREGWDSIDVVENWLLRAQHPVNGRLDVLISQTEYELGALARAHTVSLAADHKCKTLAIEDVLILKLIADRYRGNDDVESILVAQPKLDWNYLSKWLEEFDLDERLRRIEDNAIETGRLANKISRVPRQGGSTTEPKCGNRN